MMTEDYVSFETAKLLKEKGFDEDVLITDWWYDEKGDAHKRQNYSYSGAPVYYKETCCHAPTLQMAMKWLREVHKLHITILWDCGACIGKNSFCYHIDRIDNYEDKGYNKIGFDSYEEAVESAIKYCIENLI